MPVPKLPINLAVGYIKGSIESLDFEMISLPITLSIFCLVHFKGLKLTSSIPTFV